MPRRCAFLPSAATVTRETRHASDAARRRAAAAINQRRETRPPKESRRRSMFERRSRAAARAARDARFHALIRPCPPMRQQMFAELQDRPVPALLRQIGLHDVAHAESAAIADAPVPQTG